MTPKMCSVALRKNLKSYASVVQQIKRNYSASNTFSYSDLNDPLLVVASESESRGQSNTSKKHPYKSLFPWKSRQDFHKFLISQIIHNDDGLVVLNKPLGVAVMGKGNINQSRPTWNSIHLMGIGTTDYTLQDSIPFLRETLQIPELLLVKSTERMTSGIAVFAKNQKEADKFQKQLRISKGLSHIDPLYNYHVITAAVPYTEKTHFHERVAVHLKKSPLSDVKQPVIEREFSMNSIKRNDVKPITIRTTVLNKSIYKTALLQLETSSVKWNFLRVYCADLMIPILGDHLYSCRIKNIMGVPAKLDPTHILPGSSNQKLLEEQLSALQLKPDESILVPPHMHLKSFSLFNYLGKGKPLKLEAEYPEHFSWTCERLDL